MKKFIKDVLNKKNYSSNNISKFKKDVTLGIVKKYIDFSESFNGKICKIDFNEDENITYSYQRHDLQVNCKNWLKFLYNIDENSSNGAFFSCCMAVISTLLLVLRKYKSAVFSNLPYFEAFDLAEKVIDKVEEYKNFNINKNVDFLWLCSASPDFSLVDYKNIKTDIIVFDTSCLSPTDTYIKDLYLYCKENNKTLILVRSHMKIDCFGLEINRLGSLVIYNDNQNIVEKCKEFRVFLGNNTILNNIYPWLGNNEFFNITQKNVLKVQKTMEDVKKYLAKNLKSEKYEVCPFDHNIYCTIKLKQKVDNLDKLNEDITSYCQKFNLPIVTASSFFLEKVGLDNFVRRLDNNNQFLRISLSIWISKKDTLKIVGKVVEYLNNI